ncbi:MAG: hypothetical protein H6719_33370 [Sandaracinaceae bacterium]|nr:hypothetical protein [Myxococcales bacterium]MCB9597656.1 hypothetical protein [Sandaracinaceae bacterium]
MTTVTETAKRIGEGLDLSELEGADLATICADPLLADRFARQLAELASEVVGNRRWSIEDLRDIFDAAVRGKRSDGGRIVEGRYFRKRVREQCALADRYGDPFSVVVIALKPEPGEGVYQSVLDAVVERLRRTDMVFLYRRRFALVLPRMRSESLAPFVARVRELIDVGVGREAVEQIDSLVYPNDTVGDTQAVLDWSEDQLRTTP